MLLEIKVCSDIQNCWVFGLCPSSSIFKKRAKNKTFWKLDLLPKRRDFSFLAFLEY